MKFLWHCCVLLTFIGISSILMSMNANTLNKEIADNIVQRAENFSSVRRAKINKQDANGDADLHRAVKNETIDRVRYLLEHGADVKVLNKNGNAPLHLAILKGDVDLVKLCYNSQIINTGNESGFTPLHLAATRGNDALIDVLRANGARVDTRDNLMATPLHFAAACGNVAVILCLVQKHNADIHAVDKMWATPLNYAAYSGKTEAVDCLVGLGASVNEAKGWGESPLHSAARSGSVPVIQWLIANRANIVSKSSWNGRDDTVLHEVARRGHKDAISCLLSAGADPRVPNNKGETPLSVAAPHVKSLLEAVASAS